MAEEEIGRGEWFDKDMKKLFITSKLPTKEMKKLIWEIVTDLDRHTPYDVFTDEYYINFFNKYIKPCINEFLLYKE